MYRTVQEALTNATKHGHANRAWVEIDEDHSAVRVTVRGDGHGFNPSDLTSGFGLIGMRERAELVAGTIEIESKPGQGATVRGSFPARHRTSTRAV